ncbi:MAG: phage virion morphogenesis protein [Bacteroidales bacterium]|jgi:phage gpG-like protein|nr:phage virion morphogenesis protein [Bacteroidales bacterium]
MTPKEFNQNIKRLTTEYKEFFDKYAPVIAGKEAVSFFKKSFQNEAWGRNKWQEVKRRQSEKTKGVAKTRKILTGATGDLARSIEVKETSPGTVVIWTNPTAFKSKEPYGRVHNEGLKAGRGAGFTMPKRQFMGNDPELNKIIIEKLETKLKEIFNK